MNYNETETTINVYGNDKTATVFTSHSSMKRKLKKAMKDYPDAIQLLHEDRYGAKFKVPLDCLLKSKIKPPVRRELTDEQKAEYRARAQRMLATKINSTVLNNEQCS